MNWLPVAERSAYSIAKLAWKSVNCNIWPKYLPMMNLEARRPMRGGAIHERIFLACQHNIRDTFEMDGSTVFNDLPKVFRGSGTHISFCLETKKHFRDRALARSYQNEH